MRKRCQHRHNSITWVNGRIKIDLFSRWKSINNDYTLSAKKTAFNRQNRARGTSGLTGPRVFGS